MKTIKLTLVAAFFTLALVSASEANTSVMKGPKKMVHLSFSQAVQIGWVADLMSELDSGFLNTTEPTYTIDIFHNNSIIRISGSYNQWAWFFRPSGPDIDNPPNLKQIRWR